MTVRFDDGTEAPYDLVVGADGRRSTVRAAAALGGPARPVGQVVYRSVVVGGPRITDWVGVLGRRTGFVVMPMGGGRLYLYADENATSAPPDPLARLREVFGGYGGPVSAVLDAVEKVQVALTDEVVIGGWSCGPVGLVGDAAHATAPTLSQGACDGAGGRGRAGRGADPRGDGRRGRSGRTKAAAAPVPNGSWTAPATVTAPATSRRRCVTRSCAIGVSGSFASTTGCWSTRHERLGRTQALSGR